MIRSARLFQELTMMRRIESLIEPFRAIGYEMAQA
jgi:hypothetical protein